MGDESIWESGHPNRKSRLEGITFGRITRVYASEGFCEVKTFGSSGSKGDNHIPRCQWLNLDSKDDAKSAVVPQEDSFCLVFFIDGEPFVYGFFDPLAEGGEGSVTEDELKLKLQPGDRLMRTFAKNYILMRTTGVLEFVSTAGNFINMFPTGQGILKDLLRIQNKNFEFTTNGGVTFWREKNRRKDTLFFSEHRDNLSRANIIAEFKGEVDGGFIHKIDYGPTNEEKTLAVVPQPVKTHTVKKDGETASHIRPGGEDSKGNKITRKPSGEIDIQINDHTNINVAPDGTTKMNIANGKVAIEISSSGKIDIKAEADVSLENKGKLDISADGKATISANMIDLDGTGGKGSGAVLQALGFPDAISDFTGLPIQQASTTVKISK